MSNSYLCLECHEKNAIVELVTRPNPWPRPEPHSCPYCECALDWDAEILCCPVNPTHNGAIFPGVDSSVRTYRAEHGALTLLLNRHSSHEEEE